MKQISEKKAKNRKKILETARYFFARKGFYNTSITEIAKKCEIAEGTVYLYFINKEDLLYEVVEECVEHLIKDVSEFVDKVDNPLEKIFAFFDANISFFAKRPDYARVIAVELYRTPNFSFQLSQFNAFKNYTDFIKNLCHLVVDKGFTRKLDADQLTLLIFSNIDFIIRYWVLTNFTEDINIMKKKFLDIIIYGIVKY